MVHLSSGQDDWYQEPAKQIRWFSLCDFDVHGLQGILV